MEIEKGRRKMAKWINKTDQPLSEVEKFINNFMDRPEAEQKILRKQFMEGYCWHFAHMLQDTFDRGTVVWAAPFGHICWQDNDGKVYDIEGEYTGEAFYMIPEKFTEMIVPGNMFDFKHIPDKIHNTDRNEMIKIIKAYCKETGKSYYSKIEDYLCNDV